ncbi:MAG: Plug domain-containing protein, partial [Kiritimatiellota bacterium]|nr:Plug domain-containing protein [Kiritimatiellota bacterium]
TAGGFKRLEKRRILLNANDTLSAGNLKLELGVLTESVTVAESSVSVQTASAERAGVITSRQLDNLLIRGRYVMNMLELLPGVVDLDPQERPGYNWNVRVLGNRQTTNSVAVDGMFINGPANNQNGVVTLGMDALQEVKVLVSNYQAEYGRLAGANVQLVTKSGTRDFHGLGSYFKRHEQFNANNFFNNRLGLGKPRYRYNTWNYAVGGPIYIPGRFNRNRDKLFFFWSQEFWPVRSPYAATQVTVPTALERSGDFSQSLDLNRQMIVVKDPLTGQAFPGNRVPQSRLDRNGQALLNVFPQPNFTDWNISAGRYNYIWQYTNDNPMRTETLRTDYNINSHNLLFGSFTHRVDKNQGYYGIPTAGSINWPQILKRTTMDGHVLALRYQHIFSPTLISETNVGVTWRPWWDSSPDAEVIRNQRDKVGYNDGPVNPAVNPLNLIPNATFGGVTSAANLFIDNRYPNRDLDRNFSASSTLTRITGPHTIKAGIYVDHIWRSNGVPVAFNGAFDFGRNANNPLDSGYAYGNAVIGVFNSYSVGSARPRPRQRMGNVEAFLQDNWKVNRKFTLDYGMRIYLIPPPTEVNQGVSGFVPSFYDPAQRVKLITPQIVDGKRVGVDPATGKVYPAPLIGAIAPNTGNPANGMVVPKLNPDYPSSLMNSRGVHFGPRIGFAYDPFGKGRTAVRGGFGMFYNRIGFDAVGRDFAGQIPLVQTPVINFSSISTLSSSTGLRFPQDVLGLDPIGKIPTIMNYSFGIQQTIAFQTTVDVSYVGSLARHLMWARNLNAIPLGANFNPANLDPTNRVVLPSAFLRPYPGYGDILMREFASSSNYHSLQVTANRRFARSIQFGASWTWSKTMDFNDGDTNAVSTLVPVRVWNYGLAGFDRTHVLKANWIWDLPGRKWGYAPLGAALNGWQLSGIASFISGAPSGVGYSATTAVDITGSPTDGARVVVTGNPVLPKSERTFSRNFRTEVFQMPAKGTVGNAAKTLLRGPGINNWDIAVFKNFPIREQVKLQFRAETYNTFNHTQFSAQDTAARFDPAGKQVNARFGEFTAARNARIIQFALRFNF